MRTFNGRNILHNVYAYAEWLLVVWCVGYIVHISLAFKCMHIQSAIPKKKIVAQYTKYHLTCCEIKSGNSEEAVVHYGGTFCIYI